MAAGFWARFGALLLDAIIVSISLAIVTLFISGSEINKEYMTNLLSFLYSLLLPVFWGG